MVITDEGEFLYIEPLRLFYFNVSSKDYRGCAVAPWWLEDMIKCAITERM